MNPFRLTNIVKLALTGAAGLLLVGCASDHHHDDRCDDHEVVVVHEHRFDRPVYHDHDYHHHDRYYVERDAYHGDRHDRGDYRR